MSLVTSSKLCLTPGAKSMELARSFAGCAIQSYISCPVQQPNLSRKNGLEDYLMTQNSNTEQCKRRAKQIKRDYPGLSLCQRLDVAAKELGFDSYQLLIKSKEVSHD